MKKSILLLLLILLIPNVFAQAEVDGGYSSGIERPGFDANKPYYGAGFDTNVNLFSGAITLKGIGASVPGRNGLDINFQPTYSSASVLVNQEEGIQSYNIKDHGSLGLGWNGWQFGRIKVVSTSNDKYVVPEFVVEEADGSTLPFVIDTDATGGEDRFVDVDYGNGQKLPGIMLSDGSRIIWYNGNCPVYFRESSLNIGDCGSRVDAANGDWAESVQWGKSRFVRVLNDGTRITYAHFVGPVIDTDPDISGSQRTWWTSTVGLTDYSDFSDGVTNKAFQNYLPGYYVTRIEDTNGNYIDFTYYNEKACVPNGNLGLECYTPLGSQTTFDPNTYTDYNYLKEDEVYHRSATTFGSPYVKEISIEPYSCRDENSNANCANGNNDLVTYKGERKIKFYYDNVNSVHAKLLKVVYPGNEEIQSNSGKLSVRFTYQNIGTGYGQFLLKSARIYDEDSGQALFPETSYDYYTGGFNSYHLKDITSPLGGVFEVEYNRDAITSFCNSNVCPRDVNVVSRTLVKENVDDVNPLITEYYYENYQTYDPLVSPGTRRTFVVGPADNTGHRTITSAEYIMPYSWSSSYNWKSGLMLKENVWDATGYDPEWPNGIEESLQGEKLVTTTAYYYDSVLIGKGKRFSIGFPNGQTYNIRKPLKDGILKCNYDETNPNSKQCTFDEYVYYGEPIVTNGANGWGEYGYNDVITYDGVSKNFYDGYYGNVKKIIHYGEVTNVIKNYINDNQGGVNVLGFPGWMHGTLSVTQSTQGDDIEEDYYYLYRKPDTKGEYLGYIGQQICFDQGLCWNAGEVGLPEFQAVTYPYKIETKEVVSGKTLSSEETVYDELHYINEDANKLYGVQNFRRYTNEPPIKFMNGIPISNSVPNLNPTTKITNIYNDLGQLTEQRKTSYKMETSKSGPTSAGFNYVNDVPVYVGTGNVYKIRNPDWQDTPVDDYFSDNNNGKGVLTLKYDRSGFFLNTRSEWVFPPADNVFYNGYLTGEYKERQVYERNYHDEVTGAVYAVEDTSRNYVRYWYDKFGRVIGSGIFEDNPDNQASEWINKHVSDALVTYDYYDDNPEVGYPFAVEVKQRKSKDGSVVTYYNPITNFYDGLGRLIQTRQKYDSSSDLVTDVTYDEQGNKYEETVRPYLDSSLQTNVLKSAKDTILGNYDVKQTSVKSAGAAIATSAGGVATRYEDYDALQRVKEVWPYGDSSQKVLNTYGSNYIKSVNEKGIETKNYFDGFGRTTFTIEDSSNPDTSKQITTQYEYNNLGQKIRVYDANDVRKQTTYKYNSNGEILQVTNPDVGTKTNTYDKVGRLKTSADSSNVQTRILYDSLNRPVKTVYLQNGVTIDSSLTKNYEYKLTPVFGNTFDYEGYPNYYTDCNTVGRLTSSYVVDATANEDEPVEISTEYCYDYKGRVATEDQNIAGNRFLIRYEYDDSDRLTREYYPDGSIVDYSYNDLGQLNNVYLDGEEIASYTYNPKGTIESSTYGNGVSTSYTYNPRDYVESITATDSSSNIIYDRSYEYDENGNLISLYGPGRTLVASYDYDNVDRLTNVNDNGYYGTNIVYVYDKVGNRKSITTDSGTRTYQYYHTDGSLKPANLAGTNKLGKIDDVTYNYDSKGNLISKSSTTGLGTNSETYGYGVDNMLRNIKSSISSGQNKISSLFLYDVAGNRVIKKEDSRIKEFDTTNEVNAITLGRNSQVYIARKLSSSIEISVCDRFLADCEVLSGFSNVNTRVRDMYYDQYLDLLYLLLDDGITVKYYGCQDLSCTNIATKTIGTGTAITGYGIVPVRNLINNPSFEVNDFQNGIHFIDNEGNTEVFLGLPDKWAIGQSDSDNFVQRTTNDVYNQLNSMMVSDLDVNSPMSITYLTSASGGNQYTCSAYAKVLVSNPQGTENYRDGKQDLAMWFFDESKKRIDTTSYGNNCDSSEVCSTARSSTWQRISVTRTAPAGTSYVSCFVNSMGQDSGVTLWDAVQLEKSSSATAFEGHDVKIFTINSAEGKIKRYNYGLTQLESSSSVISGFDPLNAPTDIVTDLNGNVYIAGNGNDQVMEYNYGLTSVVNQLSIDNPKYIDVDKFGYLYVIDSANNALKLKFDVAGILSSYAGLVNPKGIAQSDYGIYILDKNAAGIGKVIKFADPLSFEAMYSYYVKDKLGNIVYEKQRETNTEGNVEFTTFKSTENACDQFGGCVGTTEFVNAYCPVTGDYCVNNGQCYSDAQVQNIDSNSFGYGICSSGTWNDCDTSQLACGQCASNIPNIQCTGTNCWQPWGSSGNYNGEYTSYRQIACCGDDSGEFFTTTGGRSACCAQPGMYVNGVGACVSSPGGSPLVLKEGSSPLVLKAPPEQAACFAQGEDCVWTGTECACN